MTPQTTEASPRFYSRVAGAAYLTIAIVALVYGMLVESQLVVPGNHAATADNILALLALLFRSAEAIVGATTVLLGFAVLSVLHGDAPSDAFEPQQLQALAGRFLDVRTAGLDIVLVFIDLERQPTTK